MSLKQQMFQLYGPILVVVLILAWRMRSLSRERPLNPARLWITPLILIAVALWIMAMMPPGALGLGIAAIAFLAGLALGWQRGKMIHLWRDSATGQLLQKASPTAMLLLVGVLCARFAIRQYFDANPSAGGHFDRQALIVTDALLTFAVGLISATRLELMVRAKRILSGEEQVEA